MTDKPICRYPVPRLEDIPDDVRAIIADVGEKSGFVPNVFMVLARRPDEFRAFFAYHVALMEKEGGLSLADKEMIIVATSGINHCTYCVVAHGAILRIRARNPLVADQVAVNFRKADITSRELAMLEFSAKVCTNSHEIDESDYEALHKQGFSDEDIWDIGSIAAFYAMSNRVANMTSIRPNDEFFLLGRIERE